MPSSSTRSSIVVAAIFGGTLLGVVGALLAIPVAAAGQIACPRVHALPPWRLDQMGGDLTEGLPIEGPGSDEGDTAQPQP